MARLTREFSLAVPGRSAAEVRAQLDGATGLRTGNEAGLVVRAKRDGSYRMHRPEGTFADEPVLRARVDDGPDGAVLSGRVAEAHETRIFRHLMTGTAVLMTAGAVGCVVGQIWIGVAILGVGAFVTVLIALGLALLRTSGFEAGVGRLEQALRRVLDVQSAPQRRHG